MLSKIAFVLFTVTEQQLTAANLTSFLVPPGYRL